MRRKYITTAIVLALGAAAMPASAQPLALKGSDTLEPVLSDVLATKCPAAMLSAVLSYAGGGSGGGENAMGAGTQLVAPMSSALAAAGANCTAGTNSSTAQQMVLGLDGIAVVTDAASSESCGGGHAPRGATPATAPLPPFADFASTGTLTGTAGYQLGLGSRYTDPNTKWKDILVLLFTGYRNSDTIPGTGPAGDCGNQARRDLAADYNNLWQAGGCAAGTCTGGIKHAYRRNDLSGTTDTFLGLIGAPKLTKDAAGNVTATPFCNGLETEDNDPIRRTCDATEQVCEFDGTLGLVLPISVPTFGNDVAVLYNGGKIPAAGTFLNGQAPSCINGPEWIIPGVLPAPAALKAVNSNRCDCRFPTPHDFVLAGVADNGTPTATPFNNGRFNWNTRLGGGCTVATATGTAATANWGMLNGDTGSAIGARDNTPSTWGARYVDPPGSGFSKCCSVSINGVAAQKVTLDPRLANLVVRDPATTNGAIKRNTASSPPLTVSFHRIHTSTNGKSNVGADVPTPTALCQFVDATENIGCLVQRPSENCSVGYAGLDASVKAAFAERVALNAVDPTVTTIQNLITAPGPTAYPLARKLFLNTLVGFGNLGEDPFVYTDDPTVFKASQASATTAQKQKDAQYNLAKCFYQDYGTATTSLTKAGFIALPADSGKPLCEDGCGGANACVPGDDTVLGSFDNIFDR